MGEREYDLILWGATGYTGKLAAEYLARREGRQALKWALGGRNRGKLEAVRASLAAEHPDLAELPIEVANATDAADMRKLAASTRVVATLVGPYARYGSELVAACVEERTDYCDITGEVDWIAEMIAKHHDAAVERGARIVNCCGYDSIPSDLTVWLLQSEATKRFGAPLPHVENVAESNAPSLSGGTIDSMIAMGERLAEDPALRATLNDAYALNPEGTRGNAPVQDDPRPRKDAVRGFWTAPFLMAVINTKIVRRSNALLSDAYGRDMRYDERMRAGRGPAGLLTAGLIGLNLAIMPSVLAIGPIRNLLRDRVLPKPGEGPSEKQRDGAFFKVTCRGEGPGRAMEVSVRGPGHPGYDETAKMLIESALCLLQDGDRLTAKGGILTPASVMAEPLIERLRAAGQDWEVAVEKGAEQVNAQPQSSAAAPN